MNFNLIPFDEYVENNYYVREIVWRSFPYNNRALSITIKDPKCKGQLVSAKATIYEDSREGKPESSISISNLFYKSDLEKALNGEDSDLMDYMIRITESVGILMTNNKTEFKIPQVEKRKV